MVSKEHVHMHQQGSNDQGTFLQIARHMLSNGHSSRVSYSLARDLNPHSLSWLFDIVTFGGSFQSRRRENRSKPTRHELKGKKE